ncbi:hypothetical protein [Ferrimonas marina]|uniref:Outer membrane protein beta-barrel domain-containing protein n=1 Tax=Ferrimonas marina TaxID=299255 RepID=A0A1M5ZKX7_9GAMM|nr:hypothetical protein [Ferrimonas marina]SHI24890.1 hypothetical protein SAMN02745129_0387 [Ferrimonas marina]
MKRILTALTGLLLATQVQAQSLDGASLGVMLGSDSGVAVGYHHWDMGIAVEHFKVNVDRRFHTDVHPNLYFGLGGSLSEFSGQRVGLRTKVGLSTRVDAVEFFGELVPNVTFGSNGKFHFDYALGMRLHF